MFCSFFKIDTYFVKVSFERCLLIIALFFLDDGLVVCRYHTCFSFSSWRILKRFDLLIRSFVCTCDSLLSNLATLIASCTSVAWGTISVILPASMVLLEFWFAITNHLMKFSKVNEARHSFMMKLLPLWTIMLRVVLQMNFIFIRQSNQTVQLICLNAVKRLVWLSDFVKLLVF